MRFLAIAILGWLCAGCGDETLVRLTVLAGETPPPASLRLTVVGDGLAATTRTFTPVTFPATLVIRGVPADRDVCVEAEGLDGNGALLTGGSTTVHTLAKQTTLAEVQMSNAFARCPALAGDMAAGEAPDLAGSGSDGGVALCPAGALFCDDFESGTLVKWSQHGVKYGDMGTLAPSMTRAAHGAWSVEAQASGTSGMANYAEVEEDFTPRVAPPVAVRANVWSAQPLTAYTVVMSMYDDNANGLSLGGNGNGRWVVTEDQATVGDHNSTVATTAGWHCLELVVDAAGLVSAYVDGALVIGPFARNSTLPYGAFIFGIDRTVQSATDVFVDDVAIGPSRLYCPQ